MTMTIAAPFSVAILLSLPVLPASAAQGPAGAPTRAAAPTAQSPGTTAPAQPGAPAAPSTAMPAPATSGAKPAAGTSPDYRLVPGDKLRIEVYRDAQLSQSLQVRPDGKITLPLIGDVNAEGRTSTELRDALVTALKEFNTNPVVTVIVVETVPPVFYVMGEVNTPGTFPIKGQISAVQALAMAGGFKDFAKTKSIKILRKGARGSQQTLAFNYKDATEGKGAPVYMQAGDTIIVP